MQPKPQLLDLPSQSFPIIKLQSMFNLHLLCCCLYWSKINICLAYGEHKWQREEPGDLRHTQQAEQEAFNEQSSSIK